MVGIINKLYTNSATKKDRHPVHDILGTDLYNEAKAIVQEKFDTIDIVLEKLNEIAS